MHGMLGGVMSQLLTSPDSDDSGGPPYTSDEMSGLADQNEGLIPVDGVQISMGTIYVKDLM